MAVGGSSGGAKPTTTQVSVTVIGHCSCFLPKKNFSDISLSINVGKLGNKLCGIDRPGHFSGVALIILKFLNLIQPHFLTLGQKDYQQILVIKKLINDFFFNTKVIISPTVRENSGLALSSRNQLISDRKTIGEKNDS